jgi:hypothetical protein
MCDVFSDYADDEGYIDDLAERTLAVVVSAGAAITADDFEDALEDALASCEDATAATVEIVSRLCAADLIGAPDTDVKQVAAGAAAALGPGSSTMVASSNVSSKRFAAVFSKELRKRERAAGEHEVPVEALTCSHAWDGSGVAGVKCQICAHETTKKSYCCFKDCGVKLCGSCWWNWKKKL